MSQDAVVITDLRTDRKYQIPIEHGTISALALRQIKASDDDFGLMTYDPAFQNTAACKSRITYIDGDVGILRYRGYPIEEIAEESNFLEVAYLLIDGELPKPAELEEWRADIRVETEITPRLEKLFSAFTTGAHPMGILMSAIPALGTYFPDSHDVGSSTNRRRQIVRLLAKLPILAAMALRTFIGRPLVGPDPSLGYAGNFLRMCFADGATSGSDSYRPNPVLERALDTLFVLHADHEQNCSTSVMRAVGSSRADPFAATSGAVGALWGPLHGGANEAVLHMLEEIGSKKQIPNYVERVKNGDTRLMGFGHRIYKNYDPRAKIIKQLADEVFAVQGVNPLLEIALELEAIALRDDYFVSLKLYPNVDFYSGLIYQSIGFPPDFFPVLFAIGRNPGWLAQWHELLGDEEQRIARPRQVYLGPEKRKFRRPS
jgi:citrate synthase